jgi:hypothetical protein
MAGSVDPLYASLLRSVLDVLPTDNTLVEAGVRRYFSHVAWDSPCQCLGLISADAVSVLHPPTFWEEYGAFAALAAVDLQARVDPIWLAILMAVGLQSGGAEVRSWRSDSGRLIGLKTWGWLLSRRTRSWRWRIVLCADRAGHWSVVTGSATRICESSRWVEVDVALGSLAGPGVDRVVLSIRHGTEVRPTQPASVVSTRTPRSRRCQRGGSV